MDESPDHVSSPTERMLARSGAPEEPPNDATTTSGAGELNDVTTLHRSTTKKLFGGVAGGIAERFDIDANIVRVIFLVLALVYGLGIAIYLAMWVLIPRASSSEPEDVPVQPEHRIRWLRFALPVGVVVFAVIAVATLHGAQAVSKGLALVWLVFLVVLAVVALGAPAMRLTFRRLVALAFLGLLSVLIVLSGVFLLIVSLTGVPLTGSNGLRSWQPISAAQVQRTYRGSIGETMVDLSRVSFVGTHSITASEGVGELVLEVPRNAVLDLRTDVGVGHVSNSAGPAVALAHHANPVLNLDLKVGIGEILIWRYYAPPPLPAAPSAPPVTTTTG